MEEQFHLYSFYSSSCCQRIIIAAHLKAIPLTFSFIDLSCPPHERGEGGQPYHEVVNPSGTVPALKVTQKSGNDDERDIVFFIRQSVTILEYFEERFPDRTPLLPPPGQAAARALVRDFVNIIACDVQPPANSRIAKRVRALRESLDDQVEFVKQIFHDGFTAYERLLEDARGEGDNTASSFTVGADVSLADVLLVPAVDQALIYRMDLSFAPRIMRIYESLKSLPAFQAADWRRQQDTPEKYRV